MLLFGYIMLVAAKQVFNKSVISSNPCSLSTKALLNISTLQLTPWPLCLNIMTWLHLSHCFTFIVANVQTSARDNQYWLFFQPLWIHALQRPIGRRMGTWINKKYNHIQKSLYFNLSFLPLMKRNVLIITLRMLTESRKNKLKSLRLVCRTIWGNFKQRKLPNCQCIYHLQTECKW